MRLRQIEVFHAVYTCGSMTNAAVALNVSQPSVSKVLAHAEQQLGYRLFDRVKGKLIPTPEAHQLFNHVRDVYEDVDRLRHVAVNLKAASAGRIRVAGTPAFGLEVLPRAIATFRESNPDSVFEIETLHLDELYDALRESRVDIGIAFNPADQQGIELKKVASAQFYVLVHPGSELEGKDSVSLDDLQDRPFIGLNSRGPLGQALSDFIDTALVKPKFVAWTETYHVAKALVASGAGVTITDEITARSRFAGDLVMLPLKPAVKFNIALLHVSNTPLSLAAKSFRAHLGKCVKAMLVNQ